MTMLGRKPDIKKNYKTMIGVVLLAFLLWFMVKMNSTYEHEYNVPIRYVNLDEDRIFQQKQSATARVEFVGKGKDLLRLSFYDISYEIDLSGVRSKTQLDLSEHPEYVKYPTDLDLSVKSIIRPRVLEIVLEEKIDKKLPVYVNYELETPPGYILVDVNPNPDSILVTGPKSMFSQLDSIPTENREFKAEMKLIQEPFSIKKSENYYAEYQPDFVEVSFDIQRLAEKEIENVPVTVINTPNDFQVIPLPSAATVYVKGGEKILADLNASDFEIQINFKKVWEPKIQSFKANLITDADILYMETQPPEFELIVQKEKSGN